MSVADYQLDQRAVELEQSYLNGLFSQEASALRLPKVEAAPTGTGESSDDPGVSA